MAAYKVIEVGSQRCGRSRQGCLYRFKTRRMACDLGIDEISYAAR